MSHDLIFWIKFLYYFFSFTNEERETEIGSYFCLKSHIHNRGADVQM